MKKLNINSLLLTIVMALLGGYGWLGRDMYKQVRLTREDVVVIKTKLPDMIPRAEFEVRMSQVKADQQRTDAQIEAIKVELSKMPHR